MDSNFCNYDIQKRIFKVCSTSDKNVFIFMGLGFREFKGTISKIAENIQKNPKSKDKYKDITKEEREKFMDSMNSFEDPVKELFPKLKDSFNHIFIYDDMIYGDDTCSTVLKKISQKCSKHSEDQKYIYASYINTEDDVSTPLGFKYEDRRGEKIITLEPEYLITRKLCDLFKEENEEDHDEEKTYENILDDYDIKDNMIHFINLEDFIDKHELNTIDFQNCGGQEVSAFKKRIIDKYWPQLKTMGGEMKDITDQSPAAKKIKDNSYEEEKRRYEIDSFGNRMIHSNITNIDSEKCAEIISIDLFKTTKKQSKNINVDLYKLFTDFTLSHEVPFVKWVSNNNANKYYKLFKDSIVYDGYGDYELKDTSVNFKTSVKFKTCQAWIKDLYRYKKRSLEKINRFDIIQKDDRLSFKVFSEDDTYATLSIYIDGTIDFIIKKDEANKRLDGEIIGRVSSKEQIIKLIKLSNDLIEQMNEENKYSETEIEDLGNSKEIEDIFLKNNIDFIHAKISFPKEDYEVKGGNNRQQEINNYMPPFRKGRTDLFIPILRRVCKKLTMFFRYMDEDDSGSNGIENIKDNIIGLQYKRQSNFSDINTILSLIKVYKDNETYGPALALRGQEGDDGINNAKMTNHIYDVFNFDKETISHEIDTEGGQKVPSRRDREYRKDYVVVENTPDITISDDTNSVNFEIRNMGSFMEFQRITSLTNAIMKMFGEYVNEELPDEFISLFNDDNKLEIPGVSSSSDEDEDDEEDEEDEEDSSESEGALARAEAELEEMSSSESEGALARAEAELEEMSSSTSGGGLRDGDSSHQSVGRSCRTVQKGGQSVKSYYLKRLKENDKELFKPDKPWLSKQAGRNDKPYGYAKLCGAANHRQPVSVKTKDLKKIKESHDKGEEGVEEVKNSIKVPRRSKDIHYICPQYWDIVRNIPLTKEYVDRNRSDVITDTKNLQNKTILERTGSFWDGVENIDDLIPQLMKENTHPEGYKLPCCFTGKKNKTAKKKQEKKEKEDEVAADAALAEEAAGRAPRGPTRGAVKKTKAKPLCKINTKDKGVMPIGTCSQLPMKLKKLLSQDKIFEYDPLLSVSNGFVRKGVEQNDNKFRFEKSSFINSYIELINYDGDSEKYINERLIKPLLDNIKNYQYCPTLHKYFRKKYVTQEDNKYIIEQYLDKNIGNIESVFGEDKIKTLKDILNKGDISIESNEIGYIYSLLLSLKTYIDFLKSFEEKKDQYIIPAINSISEGTEDAVNIIIFEKEDIALDGNVKTKMTEQINSDKYCFMLKQDHSYEPIVYRVNLLKEQYEIKILSINIFSTFEVFKEDIFKKHLATPYPRGRNENKLNCTGEAKHCTEWVGFKDGAPSEGDTIRWIINPSENCRNSGVKKYAIFEKEKDGYIITKDGEQIKEDEFEVFVNQGKKKVDPAIERARGKDKNKWSWINRDCDEIHDKDIESLIRQKEDPEGDKLLLGYYSDAKQKVDEKKRKKELKGGAPKKVVKKVTQKEEIKAQEEANILKALKSNFFIVIRILEDLENLKDNKIPPHDGFDGRVRKHYINNYSEITHILYDGNILLPTNGGPIKMTPGKIKNEDIIYDLDTYPEFKDVQKYIKSLKIERIAVNSKKQMICLFLESGFIPIKPEQITDDIRRKYDILKTEINPFEIDKHIMSNTNIATDGDYIIEFKKDNEEKHALFTKILNSIKNDDEIKKRIMKNIEHKAYIRKQKVNNIVRHLKKNIIPKIEKIINKEVSDKLIQEFTYKLIISVENGDKISTINKIIDNVVKYSDLEKNTPVEEVFIKYDRDKEKMDELLSDIFTKKSDFINIREGPLPSDNLRIKTTKLKTTPYYINKLFGSDTSIVFNIDGGGGDSFNLERALREIGINVEMYAPRTTDIKGIGGLIPQPIIKVLLMKLYELEPEGMQEKMESFKSSYNRYNTLRYGGPPPFENIKDVINYWKHGDNKRINKPDIELITDRIKEQNIHDFGVLLISFTKGKEMDIKFYGSDNVGLDTKVTILHHTLYKGDYILANIIVEGKKYLTVRDLYNKSDLHEKWITVNDDPQNKEEKLELLRERRDKITLMHDDIKQVGQGITEELVGINREIKELEEN